MSKVVTFHPKKMSFHLKNDIALKNIVKIHIVIVFPFLSLDKLFEQDYTNKL